MFPIPWNFPFRKKNGNLVKIGDAIDEGTELPVHGEGDVGKVLSVDESGDLEWSDGLTERVTAVEEEADALATKTDALLDNMLDNGAVNVLHCSVTSQTKSGITFTVNDDGTITANGTATESNYLTIVRSADEFYIGAGTWKLTGCPSGEDDAFSLKLYSASGEVIGEDTGDGILFTLETRTKILMQITYTSDYAFDDHVFKPMISDSALNLSYDDYVPFAKSNKELTENISDIIGNTSIDRLTLLDPQPTECAFGYAHIYDNGLMFQSSGLITLSADIATNEFIKVGTVAVGHRPTVNRNFQCAKITGTGTVYGTGLVINSNGDVTFNVRPGMKSGDQFLASGVCIK